ncbi:MAG: cysteine hydrolase [Candidatus Marinimicrobia bacterium]|nr:cysteine hydrolase [Candidatus Neomarinimicrobiota bacterium]
MMKKIMIFLGGLLLAAVIIMVILMVIYIKSSAKVTTGIPIPQYNQIKSALLVIDIQEALTGKLSYEHSFQNQSSGLLFRVNRAIDSAEVRNIPVVYIVNEITHPLINMLNSSMKKGTPGTAPDSRLKRVSELIFTKDKQDAFTNPELDAFLVKNQINRLYITGLDAAYCVKSTVLGALNRNYDVILIEDGIISKSDMDRQAALEELKNRGATAIRVEDF